MDLQGNGARIGINFLSNHCTQSHYHLGDSDFLDRLWIKGRMH